MLSQQKKRLVSQQEFLHFKKLVSSKIEQTTDQRSKSTRKFRNLKPRDKVYTEHFFRNGPTEKRRNDRSFVIEVRVEVEELEEEPGDRATVGLGRRRRRQDPRRKPELPEIDLLVFFGSHLVLENRNTSGCYPAKAKNSSDAVFWRKLAKGMEFFCSADVKKYKRANRKSYQNLVSTKYLS